MKEEQAAAQGLVYEIVGNILAVAESITSCGKVVYLLTHTRQPCQYTT
jgi:hypothetical protein